MNAARARRRWGVTDEGRRYEIFQPNVIGEGPCPGEAHGNAFIDNCMICAPRWGVVPTYAPVDVAAEVRRGFAVRFNAVDREVGERLEKEGVVRLVAVTEKLRSGSSCNFYVYVAAEGAS